MWTGHEIVVIDPTVGLTNLFSYVVGLVDSVLKVYKPGTQTWEVFDKDNIADYAIDLVEFGDESGVYTAAFPAMIAEGLYLAVICKGTKTAGGYLTPSALEINWTGAVETTAMKVLQADKKYDLELDPEQGKMLLKLKGTQIVLLSKDIKQPDGNPVTRTDQLVAEEVQP